MKTLRNQQGSTPIVLALVVVVLAVVAVAGYRVATQDTVASNSDRPVAKQAAVPETISSKADVRKANQALSSTNPDAINPNQLDSDLSAL